MELIRIATLAEMTDSSVIAEERGFNELKGNGYSDDMKEMYGVVVVNDDAICPEHDSIEFKDLNVVESKIVRMAYWGGGRLYDSSDVVAYKLKDVDGLWTIADEEAEWFI